MLPFPKTKYLKAPLAILVVFCLLFQFFPAPQPAQAGIGDTITKFINRIFKKIALPNELKLTDRGGVKFDPWLNLDCLFKTSADKIPSFCGCMVRDTDLICGWENKGCKSCDTCPVEYLNPGETCVHPFSQLAIGSSQTDEITKQGYLAMPIPNVPEICELKIPLPKGDTTNSPEEKLALRKACTYFRSIQQEAAQQVYLTKKIYNNTDPFSKCFFLRNCRSSCSLRFGEIKYTITLFDVAKLFLPVGFLSLVQKIVNLVTILQEIKQLADMFTSILQDGVGVINTLLGVVQNTSNFVSAFQNVGLKMSDIFMFSPITMVLTGETPIDRVSKGYDGFRKMIDDFSGNLLNFSSAKAEALKVSDASKKDIAAIVEGKDTLKGFKYEPEIGFLFTDSSNQSHPENYANKKRLDKILSDYQVIFKDARGVIDQLSSIGIILGVDPVVRRITAENKPECDNICALECDCRDECFKQDDPRCDLCAQESYCTSDCINDCVTEDVLLPAEVQVQSTAWQNIKGILENCCGPNGDPEQEFCRDRADQMEYVCNLGEVNCEQSGNICMFPERILSKNGAYSYTPGAELIVPDYIKTVILNALYRVEGGLQHYLDHTKGPWKDYWEQLARVCQGDKWMETQLKEKDETKRHLAMLGVSTPGACTEFKGGGARTDWTYSLIYIRNLDNDWRKYEGEKELDLSQPEEATPDQINQFIEVNCIQDYRANYNAGQQFKLDLAQCDPSKDDCAWFNTFRAIFLDLNRFQHWFALINPDYIKEVIDKALAKHPDEFGSDVYSMKILDYTKEAWRNYWEDLGRELFSWQYVADLISNNDDLEKVHKLIMQRCVQTISSLKIISDLEDYSKGNLDLPDDDPKTCPKHVDDAGITPGCVEQQVNRAYAEYKATNALYRADVFVEMDKIQENIRRVLDQRNSLAGQYEQYGPWKVKPNKYWETAAWCDSNCDTQKQTFYAKSYEPDLIDVDTGEWDERLEALNNANSSAPDTESGLMIIEDVLSAGISPDDSLLVYYLSKEISGAEDSITGAAKSFQKIIDDAVCQTAGTDVCTAGDCCLYTDTPCNPNSVSYSDYNNYDILYDATSGKCGDCITLHLEPEYCGVDVPPDQCVAEGCPNSEPSCWPPECTIEQPCKGNERGACDDNDNPCWQKDYYWTVASNELARLKALCEEKKKEAAYLKETPKQEDIGSFSSSISGYLGSLATKAQDLERIWEAKMATPGTESEAAANYVQRLVDTINTATAAAGLISGISSADDNLNSALDEAKEYLNEGVTIIPPATSSQISVATWNQFLLRDEIYPTHSGVILRLKDALKVVKEKIVDLLIKRMGDDYSCKTIGNPPAIAPGFLHEIYCFENTIGGSRHLAFDDIKNYFLPLLKKFEDLTLKIEEIRKGVLDLKPLIRLELFQMDEHKAVDEILSTVSGGAFGSWAKENKSKFYKGEKPIKTFKDLKQLFESNPLLFISGIFDELQSLLADADANLEQAKSDVGYGKVFGQDPRGLAYQTALNNIQTQDIVELKDLIFGKGDTGRSCNDLSLLLSATSSEIQQGCEEIEASSTIQAILEDPALQDDCPLLMEISVGDLEKGLNAETQEDFEDIKEDVNLEYDYIVDQRAHVDVGGGEELQCPPDATEKWPPDGVQGRVSADELAKAKLFCLESQVRIRELWTLTEKNPEGIYAKDWATSTTALSAQQAKCQNLEIYRALAQECGYFEMLGLAFKNQCNQLGICSADERSACEQGKATYVCQECCLKIRERVESNFCNGAPLNCVPNIPDLTSEGQTVELEKIREICEDKMVDIKSSLDGVMKVFSILIGIKSATGVYSGVKTFLSDGQQVIQNAQKFIQEFKEAPQKLISLWKQTYEESADISSGFSMPEKVKCMAHPAVSYQGSQEKTGVAGGPVCPNVDNYFKGLDAQFALIRQNLRQMDLTRRAVQKQYWDIGSLRIIPYDKYPVMYDAVNPIYDIAETFKKKSQYLWALATAVNFANQSCTCGNSWCKMPLCISGLPLTLDPIKNPYCYITWILRYPMEKLAEDLAEDLEAEY